MSENNETNEEAETATETTKKDEDNVTEESLKKDEDTNIESSKEEEEKNVASAGEKNLNFAIESEVSTEPTSEENKSDEKNGDDDKPTDIEVKEENKEGDDIITVPDNEEENVPCKTIPDVVFYDNVTEEEKEYYEKNCPSLESVDTMTVQCTACWKQVNHHILNNIQRHPDLGVALCKACKDFYEEGEWEKDEEGTDTFCRWCGNGGEVLGCDKCCQVFCKRCITRNLGRAKFKEINDSDEWGCFTCDPSQIYKQRALMLSISKWSHEQRLKKKQREKDKLMRKKMESAKKKQENKKQQQEKKIETELGKIENFVDENIHEAFDTLAIYQKCLEDERRKWIRVRKTMTANNAATAAKSLRRIFAITKQNMDLLDTALVQGYGEHFPEEVVDNKLKFSMGASCKSTPVKSTPVKSTPKSTPNKRKMKNTTGKAKPPPSDDDCIEVEEIVVNGEKVYANGDTDDEGFMDPSMLCSVEITGVDNRGSETDSSSNRKVVSPKKKSPKQRPSGALRISSNMFKRKRSPGGTPRSSKKARMPARNDSEIEEITLDDDDDSTGYVSQATLESLANQSIMAKANRFATKDDDGDSSDVSLE